MVRRATVTMHRLGKLGPSAEEEMLLAQVVIFNGRRMTVQKTVQKGYLDYGSVKGEFRITTKTKTP